MTPQTPEISFTIGGDLSIKGVSIPENTYAFYSEAIAWLKEFEFHLPNKVTLNLEFEYLNTASNRSIIDLVRLILKYKERRIEFRVNWLYEAEDDDAIELGEDLEFCVDMKFNFIPKRVS